MKKAICILLSLCMLLGSFAISVGAAEPEMKVLVTSDVHWQNVGSVNPTGFFRPRAALDRLLVGFFVDKAPADNDVTLPGYTANQGTGFLARLRDFFRRFPDFFRGFFGTLG